MVGRLWRHGKAQPPHPCDPPWQLPVPWRNRVRRAGDLRPHDRSTTLERTARTGSERTGAGQAHRRRIIFSASVDAPWQHGVRQFGKILYEDLSPGRHHIVKIGVGTHSLPAERGMSAYEFVHALYRHVLLNDVAAGPEPGFIRLIGRAPGSLSAAAANEEVVPDLVYTFRTEPCRLGALPRIPAAAWADIAGALCPPARGRGDAPLSLDLVSPPSRGERPCTKHALWPPCRGIGNGRPRYARPSKTL